MHKDHHRREDEGAARDVGMLSLPELCRLAGVPMPMILRLSRENPRELPSVGSGSQLSFPEGVVPTLRKLFAGEREARGIGTEEHHRLFTLSKARREREKANGQARRPERKARRSPARTDPELQETLSSPGDPEPYDLEQRLIRLEESVRELAEELARMVEECGRPYRCEVPTIEAD